MRNLPLLRALMTVLLRPIALRTTTAMTMTIIVMNLAPRLAAHVATAPVAATLAKTMPRIPRVKTLRITSRILAMTRTKIAEIPAIMMAITRDRSPTRAITAITVSAAAVTTTAATTVMIAMTVMTATTTAVIIGEKAVVATMTTPATMTPGITTIVVTTAATIAAVIIVVATIAVAITAIIAGAATITKMMTTVVAAAVVAVTVAAAGAMRAVTPTTTCRFAREMNCRQSAAF